jgi:hypothetical protein
MWHSKSESACEDDPVLDFAEVPWPQLGRTLPFCDTQHRNVAWSRDQVSGSKSNKTLQDFSFPEVGNIVTFTWRVVTLGIELVSNSLAGHNPKRYDWLMLWQPTMLYKCTSKT